MAGWLVGPLAGWLFGRLPGWPAGRLAGWMTGTRPAGWTDGCLDGWLPSPQASDSSPPESPEQKNRVFKEEHDLALQNTGTFQYSMSKNINN